MKTIASAFSRLSRRGKWLVVLGVGLVALTGAFLFRTYHYVRHEARFCQSCHIMQEPFQKWLESPHHLVTCHKCHKQSLSDSLRQVWFYLIQHPENVIHHPVLDHTVCAPCHLSQDTQWKLIGETAGHKIHFERAGIDCLLCHVGGIHKFSRPVDACATCHADKMEGPERRMAFMHCVDCHKFLATREALVPDRETCLECHRKIQVGRESFPEEAPMASLDS